MIWRIGMLAALALFVRTEASAAQTDPGTDGPIRAPFSFGIEAGLAANRIETIHGSGAATLSSGPSSTDSAASLNLGAVGLYSPFRFWSFGPRLSTVLLPPPTYSSTGSVAMEAGLLSVFHLHPSDTVGPRPRILLGAGWSWETVAAPRSFAIKHTVSPASGVCSLIGLGFEKMSKSVARQWWLDLRYFYCAFEHEHSMLDTRTQERRTESLDVHRTGILVTFGFGWFVGG